MADSVTIVDIVYGVAQPAPPSFAVNIVFGSQYLPGVDFTVVIGVGEAATPVVFTPDSVYTGIAIKFKDLWVESEPDEVKIVFGDNDGVTDILPLPIGTGESVSLSLSMPEPLGTFTFATGESIVSAQRQLRDPRLYPAVAAAAEPFKNGWAFLSSALNPWPAGYTQSGIWHHFYGLADGISIDFPRPNPLITPTWTLQEIFGAGNGFFPVYAAQQGSAPGFTGESLETTLRLEFVSMGKTHSTGETFSWTFATRRQLTLNLSHGQSVVFELEVLSMRTEVWVGESVSLSLDVYDLVGLPGFTGETLTTVLTTESTLRSNLSAGEQMAVVFTTQPAAYMALALSDGQTFSTVLLTKQEHRFTLDLGDGQTFTTVLGIPNRADLAVAMSTGSTFAMPVFSLAIAFGEVVAWEGPSVAVLSLDELSNYKAADGVTLTVSFAAAPYFSPHGFDGVTLSAGLDTRPPAGLSCVMWTGEEFLPNTLATMISANLRVTFCDGVFIEASDSTATTYYDLEGPPSYPNRLQWWLDMNQFEFIDMPPSFSWGSGAGIVVKADLQARPRFSINFATGESFAMERGYDYMDIVAQSGLESREQTFFYIEPHINLCYPNVFPNADAMEVELDITEENCYADYLYDGVALQGALSCVYTVAPVWWEEGSRLDFNLTIYDLWRVTFWHGQTLVPYLSTAPALQVSFWAGESMAARLEEPTVEIGTGESCELNLTITFEVEFLEEGCLDNEYKYMTPSGDEDKEKFNPVAVELEPFAHEIKARCF